MYHVNSHVIAWSKCIRVVAEVSQCIVHIAAIIILHTFTPATKTVGPEIEEIHAIVDPFEAPLGKRIA